MPLKFAVMVSGSGTDLQSILDSPAKQNMLCVISSKEGAYALERARRADVPAVVIQKKDFASQEAFDEAILNTLRQYDADFVVLAGYLHILGEKLVQTYENRIINIHPSLIPSFCGMGYYGLKVHEGVLDYGCKVTGATVHFVDAGADTGPIIWQEPVRVHADDTPQSLQQRVLETEHVILPRIVGLMMDGKIKVCGRKVIIEGEE